MGVPRRHPGDPRRAWLRGHAPRERRHSPARSAAVSTRRLAFRVAVVLTLALAALFGSMVVLMNVMPGFMNMTHFTEEHHRIHDLTFSLLNGTVVVGMLAQLRSPTRSVAGQLMALVPFAALLLAVALTNGWV